MARRFCLAAILVISPVSAAGQVQEYQMKAAFLYNFAKFVEWPATSFKSTRDPIEICILGQNPFGNALEQTVSGKTVDDRPFLIRTVNEVKPDSGCHMLFVSAVERRRFRAGVGALKGAAILTVGEAEEFTSDGGVIRFKLEGMKLHLEINVVAADFENIRISSKLLSLAEVVRRVP